MRSSLGRHAPAPVSLAGYRELVPNPRRPTPRSASSTAASAGSRSRGRSSISCRTSRSSTSATPRTRPTGRSRSPRCAPTRSQVLDDLVAQGVKALVIACNTASAAMLRDARERYEAASGIPVVEVIQPAVRAAVRATRNGRVGVIGTVGTIQSRAYDDAFAAASGLELFTAACPRFVEFVEAGVDERPRAVRASPRSTSPRCATPTSTPSCSAARTTR